MRREYGFTLMEVMMAIILVSILSTIAALTYSNITVRTKKNAATAELKLLLAAASAYRSDYETYPSGSGIIDADHLLVKSGYITDPNIADDDWTAYQIYGNATSCAFNEVGKGGLSALWQAIYANGTISNSTGW